MAEDALVGAGGIPLSADILRRLLDASQDVLYAVALSPVHMVYATPAFARRMGLPKDFLAQGYEFSQYLTSVHPDDIAKVAEVMAAIVASRSDADLPENPASYRLRNPEGGWRVISDSYSILRNPDGVPHTLIGNARDVSEHNHAQQTLKEREARFRLLAENSRDLFFSIRFPEGRYEYLSPSVEPLFGFTSQDFYNDPGMLLRCVAPDWRETVQGWMTGIAQGTVAEHYEFQVLDKAGRLRWFNQRQVLVPTPDGQGMLLQGVATDVTDLREAQQALADNEARFRSLAENSRDTFFSFHVAEARYEFISANVAELLGHSAQDFYADPGLFMRYVAPQWRESMAAWNAEITQGHVRDRYEFEVLDRQGRLRWIVERLVLVPAPDGQSMLLQGVVADITEERAAREALRQSEERYRELAEGWLNQAVIRINLHTGRYEYVSPGMEKVFGFAPEEFYRGERGIVGRTVAPEWRETVQEWMAEARRGQLRPEYEFELIDAWGARRWVRQHCTLLHAADGTPEVVQGVLYDNTEHHRLEAELAASERKHRTLHESMRDGFAVVNMDGLILEHNNAFRDMLGYTDDEIGGLTYRDITPERWHDTEARILADQVFVRGYSDVYEKEYRRKDGTEFPVSVRTYMEADASGQPQRLWAVVRDISEHMRTEAALRESEERFREVVEGTQSLITQVDGEGRFTYVNPMVRVVLGLEPEDCIGRLAFEIIHPDDREATMAAFQGWVADRLTHTSYENRLVSVFGEVRHFSWSIRFHYDGQGNTTVIDSIARDITEQKRAEEALRETNARYSLLAGNVVDVIWTTDAALRWTYVSPSVETLSGYPLARFMALPFEELFTAEGLGKMGEFMVRRQKAATREEQDKPYRVEVGLRHADGSLVPLEVLVRPMRGPEGEVIGYCGTSRDITKRKQAEEALFKSERLSRKLLESMHEGVWAVDANRRTTFVNERLCAMLGYASAELMNMSPTDVLEWPQRHVAKSQLSDLEAGYSGATDYVLIRKDGSRFPAHVVSSPVMEEQGRFEGLVCGVVDLTERARMEHELRRNQARFEALYELSRLTPATEFQLASFTLREAIRLTDSSAGVLFFVSEDAQQLVPKAWETGEFMEAVGQVPSFPTSGAQPWAIVVQSALPLLINDFSQCSHLVPPGHPPVLRFLGVPALDGSRPAAVLGLTGKEEPYTAEDTLHVTLLLDGMWREVRTRRDEERIRASLNEKEALLHEVHHRVKNNLQVISSLMDMAGRRLASAEARMSLTELRGKVQAMSLIHAQLHGAGSGGGISLERFVRALFNQLREVYAGGLDLSVQLQLGELTLSLDQAVPLGLALNETLTNVFKHACPPVSDGARRASRVEIRAERDMEGRVSIEIEDNGPGLPEGFEPDSAETLGMKLTRGLVRHQLRGELTFRNTAPGVCVSIRFRPHVAI